jgi:hypothetical protein
MNQLVDYLSTLENRVRDSEANNASLQRFPVDMGDNPARTLPKTGLVSDKFLTRAFTVWGDYFVAQLIISLPIFLLQLIWVFYFFFLNRSGGLPTF